MNIPEILIFLILGLVAATIKILATREIARRPEFPRPLRAVSVLRTVFFFLFVAVGLGESFVPSAWRFPSVGFDLFLALVGIWMSLMITFPILAWRYGNAFAHREKIGKAQ